MLVDSHCHLDFPDFAPERDAVVQRARDAGVGLMLSICTHVSKFGQVLDVAQSYPDVYCTLGIHPHQAAEEFAHCDVEKLIELAKSTPKGLSASIIGSMSAWYAAAYGFRNTAAIAPRTNGVSAGGPNSW